VRLSEVARLVREAMPGLTLTVDAAEARGFEYETGVSFTMFARGVRGEIGRGGRYAASGGEPATGFTLFMDTIGRAVPEAAAKRRVFLPAGTDARTGQRLRAQGWVTVAALDKDGDARGEAGRLGCTHVFSAGKPVPLAKRG
jgi:ATP phosphoribosyltransferase regulatory subunit